VLRLPNDGREENPVNLDRAWPSSPAASTASTGSSWSVLDVDRVLEMAPNVKAA